MSYSHIIFDLDGTLVDSVVEIHASAAATCERHGLQQPELAYIQRMTGSPPRLFFIDHGCQDDQVDLLVEEFRQHLGEHAGHPDRVFPGSLPLLMALKDRGIRTSIATTKPTQLAASLLERYGLSPWLDHIQGTDPPLRHKPHPDIILACMNQAPDHQVLMVGDTIFDVQAAQNAEISAAAVCSGAHTREQLQQAAPNHLVDSLTDLFAILELRP